MTAIHITFPKGALHLHLGAPLSEVEPLLSAFHTETDIDPQLTRTHIILPGDGAELLFKDGSLATVFLFLTPTADHPAPFAGETDLLGPTFFADPQPEHFTQILDAEGFYAPPRSYPFATDRLSDTLRLRLETRPDQVMIMIDDGARIR